jgi:hypothetical protein
MHHVSRAFMAFVRDGDLPLSSTDRQRPHR